MNVLLFYTWLVNFRPEEVVLVAREIYGEAELTQALIVEEICFINIYWSNNYLLAGSGRINTDISPIDWLVRNEIIPTS